MTQTGYPGHNPDGSGPGPGKSVWAGPAWAGPARLAARRAGGWLAARRAGGWLAARRAGGWLAARRAAGRWRGSAMGVGVTRPVLRWLVPGGLVAAMAATGALTAGLHPTAAALPQ